MFVKWVEKYGNPYYNTVVLMKSTENRTNYDNNIQYILQRVNTKNSTAINFKGGFYVKRN